MALTPSIYNTNNLIRVVEYLKNPQQFLLDMFFPNVVTSDSELVSIDVYTNKRRMAPFVDPLIEGKFVEQLGVTTPTYKPPYLKPKTRLDTIRPIRRMIGERIGGGDMTPVQREAANLAMEMQQQIGMIDRRLEWMAANALANGAITVTGDGVPSSTINFGRDASLSVALTGSNRWGQTGISPAQNIDDWSVNVLQVSGFPVTDVIFTPTPWKAFRADTEVSQIIASLGNPAPSLRVQGNPAELGGQYMGQWGSYRLWRYFDWYIDPTSDTEVPMLADGTVILASSHIEGVRSFATILDPEVGYPAIPYAPKSWTTQDPGARWLMTQSAPLVIPTYVNASFAATVI
jgi:hypothetical protein